MKKMLLLKMAILLIVVITGSQTSFGQELPSSNLSNVAPVNGTNISVNYDITSGKLLSINVDAQSKSLIISIQSTDDGKFTLSIPRSLLDARENGQVLSNTEMPDGFFAMTGNTMFHSIGGSTGNVWYQGMNPAEGPITIQAAPSK